MRISTLMPLVAGFILAMVGVIVMFHLYKIWLGLGITLEGFYVVIRAVYRDDDGTSN